ncbi:MAG: 2-amino-3,7-dideoxy-D-threo-hept-6-ulosonate synthase [Promethearchaeota archaeon]
MSSMGKAIRLERIFNRKSGRTIVIPMDHGLTVGVIPGLEDLAAIVDKVARGGASAVLEHAGMAQAGHRGSRGIKGPDVGLIVHLSGSTILSRDPNHKVLVCSVTDALKMGADAVSVHVNIGADDEPEMLESIGFVSSECREWGMPLLAMMYPRGDKIKDENAPEVVNVAARAGAELGADIVKTNYTGDIDTFKEIVRGIPVPVIIAGGPKMDTTKDVLQMIYESVQAGGSGVAMGRNVFQARDPEVMVRCIAKVVHEGYTVEEVIKEYGVE